MSLLANSCDLAQHQLRLGLTMMDWLESLVLGVVQGITEFLPVSSDGHLLLTQNLFAWLTGVAKSGKENLFFDVILHLGTTAAILVHYRREIAEGLRGLLGADDVPPLLVAPRSYEWDCWPPWRRRRSFRSRCFSRK